MVTSSVIEILSGSLWGPSRRDRCVLNHATEWNILGLSERLDLWEFGLQKQYRRKRVVYWHSQLPGQVQYC